VADHDRPRPTISDVARRAGVSKGAVSFAVNGRPGVSPETRAHILAVAEELGWRPSARARALARAHAGAVALILARSIENLEGDEFFLRFLVGVEPALARRDCALLLHVTGADEESELAAYDRLLGGERVDGVILTDLREDDPRPGRVRASGLAAVIAGRTPEPAPFPWVETAHADGVTAAVEHLLELGHRRIGFVGGDPRLEHVEARRAAWERALRDAGVEPGPAILGVTGDRTGEQATHAALDAAPHPTALLFIDDVRASAGMAVASRRGLRVPDDVSVVGFDDYALSAHTAPPLTTVRVEYDVFGRAAAELLLAHIAGEEPPEVPVAGATLVVRGSTGPPPA